jgi:hypothetical protein
MQNLFKVVGMVKKYRNIIITLNKRVLYDIILNKDKELNILCL